MMKSHEDDLRQNTSDPLVEELLALERAALTAWGQGDPDGYLGLSASDVTYFDPFLERRIDDRAALVAWYAPLRGTIRIDRNDFVAPMAQRLGNAAVLTFQLVSEGSGSAQHWNCTEVYVRRDDRWQIVHTHWSFTKVRG